MRLTLASPLSYRKPPNTLDWRHLLSQNCENLDVFNKILFNFAMGKWNVFQRLCLGLWLLSGFILLSKNEISEYSRNFSWKRYYKRKGVLVFNKIFSFVPKPLRGLYSSTTGRAFHAFSGVRRLKTIIQESLWTLLRKKKLKFLEFQCEHNKPYIVDHHFKVIP